MNGLNGDTMLNAEDILVGYLPSDQYGYRYSPPRRLRVTVSVQMERLTRQPEYETVSHEMVTEPSDFTLTTAVWRPDNRDIVMGGAIVEPLLDPAFTIAPGFTADDIATLTRLHVRWHLNSMKAACAHQVVPDVPESVPRLGHYEWLRDHIPPCPETGYKYGHAWLLEPLPEYLTPDYVRGLLHIEEGK